MSSANNATRELAGGVFAPCVGTGLATAVAGFLVGPRAGLAALAGTAVLIVFFSGVVALSAMVEQVRPSGAMAVAMGVYAVQVSTLMLFLFVGSDLTFFSPAWFAATVILGTVCWSVLHVRAASRLRVTVSAAPLGRSR